MKIATGFLFTLVASSCWGQAEGLRQCSSFFSRVGVNPELFLADTNVNRSLGRALKDDAIERPLLRVPTELINEAYFDLIDQMQAIALDPAARIYLSSSNGQQRAINRIRLKAVAELYKNRLGRELDFAQIAAFHLLQIPFDGAAHIPDECLLGAVATYLANLNAAREF
jgi:hypothetical protein